MMLSIINHFKNHKQFFIKCTGQSMMPLIFPNDVIYLKRVNFPQIKNNDIVLVKKSTKALIHRVIYKNSSYAITKGDNSHFSDGKVYPNQIVGRVHKVKRNGQIFRPEDIYLLQSTQYFGEIKMVKQAFNKEGIDFVFLKGLPLYMYFERSHPKRIYADCDVLVYKDAWEKAKNIMEKFGYRQVDSSCSQIHKILKNKPT